MIPEVDTFHGVVLRQLLVESGKALRIAVSDASGRIDAFAVEDAAIQIKHSTKRLSPWQFTYMPDAIAELRHLRSKCACVWAMLVCGSDGIVGLSFDELMSVAFSDEQRPSSLRVRRNRKGMYRISGSRGELPYARSRGVLDFLVAAGIQAA